jgi:hypothetical protein
MRRILFLLSLLLFFPATVLARAVDARIEDTLARYPTEVEVQGLVPEERVTVVVTPPRGSPVLLQGRADHEGELRLAIAERSTEVAGTYTFEVVGGGGELLAEGTFEVFADPSVAMALEVEQTPRVGETVLLRARITDQHGNPQEGRPLLVISPDGEVQRVDEETQGDGTAEFLFTPQKAGEATMIVIDTLRETSEAFSLDVPASSRKRREVLPARLIDEYRREDFGTEESPTVPYGYVASFGLEIDRDGVPLRVVPVNESLNLTVTALDANGNRVEDYVGKIVIESTTDLDARVPLEPISVRPSDRGRIRIPLGVAFGTPGLHELLVYDPDESVEGRVEVLVSGQQAREPGSIRIISPPRAASIGTEEVTVQGKAPAFINLELLDNGELLAKGESNEDGIFTFTVMLDLSIPVHELLVKEGPGGLDRVSHAVTLTVDTKAPLVREVHLLPSEVLPGDPVTVSVIAESLHEVQVVLPGEEPVALSEEPTGEEGMSLYEGTITAPEVAGEIPITVAVRDAGGNTVEQTRMLTVQSKAVPVVAGLQALVEEDAVLLSWEAVQGAASYRIYFGFSPSDLSQHLDTGSPLPRVRIRNLASGKTYAFAVTALDAQGLESTERSTTTTVSLRGSLYEVRVLPLINGAAVHWLPSPQPVGHYRLRYGVQPGAYLEERIVGPSETQAVLSDLINGIPYYLQLSAVLVDGTVLPDSREFSVTPGIEGQPGFHLSAPDPLPLIIGGSASSAFGEISVPLPGLQGAVVLPLQGGHGVASPPRVPRSGSPLTVGFLVLLLLGTGLLLRRLFLQRRVAREILAEVAKRYAA